MNAEELYTLVDAVPESKWADVKRYLKTKALSAEAPTDEVIEAITQKYAKGEFYKYATTEDLKAGFRRVNEMIMNRKEFNEVFEVSVSEKRWVSLKTYLRDLNQPENMPTVDEIEMFALHDLQKESSDYVTYSHEELIECFLDDCEEVTLAKVKREDLLQSIDHMSAEHLNLVSEYVMNLKEENLID